MNRRRDSSTQLRVILGLMTCASTCTGPDPVGIAVTTEFLGPLAVALGSSDARRFLAVLRAGRCGLLTEDAATQPCRFCCPRRERVGACTSCRRGAGRTPRRQWLLWRPSSTGGVHSAWRQERRRFSRGPGAGRRGNVVVVIPVPLDLKHYANHRACSASESPNQRWRSHRSHPAPGVAALVAVDRGCCV